jgi:hypothetical protein
MFLLYVIALVAPSPIRGRSAYMHEMRGSTAHTVSRISEWIHCVGSQVIFGFVVEWNAKITLYKELGRFKKKESPR